MRSRTSRAASALGVAVVLAGVLAGCGVGTGSTNADPPITAKAGDSIDATDAQEVSFDATPATVADFTTEAFGSVGPVTVSDIGTTDVVTLETPGSSTRTIHAASGDTFFTFHLESVAPADGTPAGRAAALSVDLEDAGTPWGSSTSESGPAHAKGGRTSADLVIAAPEDAHPLLVVRQLWPGESSGALPEDPATSRVYDLVTGEALDPCVDGRTTDPPPCVRVENVYWDSL